MHFIAPCGAKNSRLCTKGGMVAIVTSAKCTRPSVARAVFTRVTSPPCRSRYTRRFVSKIGGNSRVSCECVVTRGQSSFGRYEDFARWSGRYEHFDRFWRRGTIDCMPLYVQACNATFSARLDTNPFVDPPVEKKSCATQEKHLFSLVAQHTIYSQNSYYSSLLPTYLNCR